MPGLALANGDRAEHFDLVWAAGGDPRPRELPFLASAVGGGRGPVVVGAPARQLPVMDAAGRWKQLPSGSPRSRARPSRAPGRGPCQQLVWIGVELDVDAVQAVLAAALVDDAEEVGGVAAWSGFIDPLPTWP